MNSFAKHINLYTKSLCSCSRMFGLLLILFNCLSCDSEEHLFELISSQDSGLTFKNEVIENDTFNILNFTNLYTGSGVGIGDFNRDGLPDVFLGGNMESSRLYLNKGNLKFEDITKNAKVSTDRWVTGVTIVDINADGWDDIYLCVSGIDNGKGLENLLFINKQDNTFEEQAQAYGLNESAQCTHANFFDYDKDGDLDVFMIVNPTDYKLSTVNSIRKRKLDGSARSTDKLYRNDNGIFSDVSEAAGILIEGYSLGLNISDLNADGWPDVYVSNDFLSNDILYINNQDGTFTNEAETRLKHTSFASMGVDVADITNDGLPEIYVLDMLPEDNYRKKMILGNRNYDRFNYMLKMGYEPQYSRNTLQLNNGDGTFAEVGQLAGLHQTDWSWSPLFADFDNDGLKDLFITNGFRRDLGNLDYINYGNQNPFGDPDTRKQDQLKRITQQPGAQLSNYMFKNESELNFTDQTQNWGLDLPSYSHGAAYADFDLDGDLDLIIGTVAQEVLLYQNHTNQQSNNNFIKIKLTSKDTSQSLFGTKVFIHTNEQQQFLEFSPYHGYQSSVEPMLHFGLGTSQQIDSIEVIWNDGMSSVLKSVNVNQTLDIDAANRKVQGSVKIEALIAADESSLFKENQWINYLHQEDQYVDFKTQFLLPHQHSKSGPCLAVADVNNDGLEDVFIGGAAGFSGMFFIQNPTGGFDQITLETDQEKEDTDCVFFDFDGDQDMDLIVVSGGIQGSNAPALYQDRLYLNEAGVFKKAENILPVSNSPASCVIAEDYDSDGDIDLFIGGLIKPYRYPLNAESYLLENRNQKFYDVAPPELKNIGIVKEAIWTDFDNDSDKDLLLVGEWMPLTFFENKEGKINDSYTIVSGTQGWWNTIAQGDFDNDGDIDYFGGNLGLNSDLKASNEEPVRLYANDFDKNGSIDPVLCQYLDGKEYPVVSRDDLIEQIPPVKVRFNTYKKYAEATFDELFKAPEKKGMRVLEATLFENCYFENLGDGTLKLHRLNHQLQFAPIHQFMIKDLNKDGKLDVLCIGNDYETEVGIGRYDAFRGALLIGDGSGTFDIIPANESGFIANKNAKSITSLQLVNGEELIIVGNNSDQLQCFIIENKANLTLNAKL